MRLGGLGIIVPLEISNDDFENSCKMTKNITSAIRGQQSDIHDDLDDLSRSCKLEIRSERSEIENEY